MSDFDPVTLFFIASESFGAWLWLLLGLAIALLAGIVASALMLRRAGRPDLFDQTPNICVMRAAMALGVKKAGGGRGFPKLTDCAAHLGLVIDEAHSAKGDTRATLALFRHLHAVGALPEAKVHLAKTPPLAPNTVEPLPATAMPESF